MQPESQAILREFNRRLRAALREAPNHIRVEAALEVESHVLDVLNRSDGKEPEHEMVARVLSGFGSPEAYANALLSQLVGQPAATVGNGLKEVSMAGIDLLRGLWRLTVALLLGTLNLLGRLAGALWIAITRTVTWLRGPVGQAARWLRINVAATLYGLRRGTRTLLRWGGESAGKLVQVGDTGGHLLLILAKRLVSLAVRLVSFAYRCLCWAIRAAGVAALAMLAALCMGVAAFSALAPDVTGWFAHGIALSVGEWLDQVRRETIGHWYMGTQADLTQTGIVILGISLALGTGLIALLIYIGWTSRRRRGATIGQ